MTHSQSAHFQKVECRLGPHNVRAFFVNYVLRPLYMVARYHESPKQTITKKPHDKIPCKWLLLRSTKILQKRWSPPTWRLGP